MRLNGFKKYFVFLLICLLITAGCSDRTASDKESLPASVSTPDTVSGTNDESAASSKENGSFEINLKDNACTANTDNVAISADGNTVTIKRGGIYTCSGSLSDGNIIIKADSSEDVKLILNGTDISSETLDAIYCKKARSLVIELADATDNHLCSGTEELNKKVLSGETIIFDESVEDAISENSTSDTEASGSTELDKTRKAVIYSKSPLYITGNGNLRIDGLLNNGIQVKSIMNLDTANITLTAANDGVKASDRLTITSGKLDVTSNGDAVSTDGELKLDGGDIRIVTGGGSEAAEMKSEFGMGPGFPFGDADYDQDDTSVKSKKGMKSGGSMVISGGTVSIDSEDDCVHCDADLTVSGGSLFLASGDDGIHADTELLFTGGETTVTYCYEGIEAPVITVDAGSINVTSDDDGFNAGGSTAEGLPCIYINDGTVYVDAGGDGLDSNGDLVINGGNVYVDGPPNSMNAAIDIGSESGGRFLINGGSVTAIGMSGMLENPEADSEQVSVTYVFTEQLPENTEVTVSDSSGNMIYSFTTKKKANCVTLSDPVYSIGETYTFSYNETEGTISVTAVNASNSSRGGFGGMGGFGPGGGGPGRQ